MSQQGERRERPIGREDDWWRELYDGSAQDAGPSAAGDSLDDRFASAGAVVENVVGTTEEAPEEPKPDALEDPGKPEEPDEPGKSHGPGKSYGPSRPYEPPEPPEPPGPGMPGMPGTPGRSGGLEAPEDLGAPEDLEALGDLGAPEDQEAPEGWGAPEDPGEPQDLVPPPPVPPRGAAGVPHVGSGPPTYEAEPTALPLAEPDALGDVVPDTVLDGARYGACTVRAVSLRGDSGRFRGEPRRDALLTARFGSGEDALVFLAVATGARGTPGAHRAAAALCRHMGRAVGRSHARLAEDIRAGRRGDLKSGLQRLTDRSLGRLRAEAVERGADPDTYTASLRCLLLPADPGCRIRVFFGAGEGGLFRLRDGEWQDIEPRAGEGAEGARGADRLTMDLGIAAPPSPYRPAPEPARAPFRFRASVARPGDVLLLCTAGLADPLRGEPELPRYLTDRWAGQEPPGLAAFLADAQVRVKGYADDRTAAAVWERREASHATRGHTGDGAGPRGPG